MGRSRRERLDLSWFATQGQVDCCYAATDRFSEIPYCTWTRSVDESSVYLFP